MPNTRQVILETLSQHGPLPLEAIAQSARQSKMALRYHLTLLLDAGLVVPQVTRAASRGCVGRPQMLYALAEDGQERLPKQYHQLAEQLVDAIVETLGPKEARVMLRRAGRRAAESAPALRRGAGVQAQLNRAVEFLSERGYMARWEKANGELALRVGNCPYRVVAREHRQVCEMDVAMISALMDAPMKMTHCMANRDCACSFVIRKSK